MTVDMCGWRAQGVSRAGRSKSTWRIGQRRPPRWRTRGKKPFVWGPRHRIGLNFSRRHVSGHGWPRWVTSLADAKALLVD